jgi:hypothetical protein
MGALTIFIYFLDGAMLIGQILEHWALPNTSTSFKNWLQIRNKCAPYSSLFQFIYMRVELWAKHMG